MTVKPMTILLVEDDDVHALLVHRSLESSSFSPQIYRVANGLDALEFLRHQGPYEHAPVPDVILLDLRLPKATGHEVLGAIKSDEHLRSIPVVVMTTSRDELDRAKAYRQHANSYVVKPADFEKFRQVVQDVSHYWGVCNERPVL
jgi:CheY-like chemotaxis protein